MKKISILLLFISTCAFSRVKSLDCSAFVESTLVHIIISHDTDDFNGVNKVLRSMVSVKTENISYELNIKKISNDMKSIDFTFESTLPFIDNTNYQLNVVNLIDNYPELDRDDVFFGTMLNTDPSKNKYITNFDRMGGELLVLFYCKVN